MISVVYVKKIINNILENEHIDKNKIKIHCVTPVEYAINSFINKKFKLVNTMYSDNYLNYDGYFSCLDKKIVIFLKGNKKPKKMINILLAIYHEVEHYKQIKLDLSKLNDFMIYLDTWRKIYNKSDYEVNHDNYMFEIMANVEMVYKTKKIINERKIKGIDLIEDSEYLDCLDTLYQFDNEIYDYYESFDTYLNIYREHKNEMKLPKYFEKFLNTDGTFKSVSEIIKLNKNLDVVILVVLACDSFRMEKNLSSLKGEEAKVIEYANFIRRIYEEKIQSSFIKFCELEKNYKNFKIMDLFVQEKNFKINHFKKKHPEINSVLRR